MADEDTIFSSISLCDCSCVSFSCRRLDVFFSFFVEEIVPQLSVQSSSSPCESRLRLRFFSFFLLDFLLFFSCLRLFPTSESPSVVVLLVRKASYVVALASRRQGCGPH